MRLTYSETEGSVVVFLDAFSEGQLVLYNCRLSIAAERVGTLREHCLGSHFGKNQEIPLDFTVAVTTDDGEAHSIRVERTAIRYSDAGVAFGFSHDGVDYGSYTVPWQALGRASLGESVAFEQSVYYG